MTKEDILSSIVVYSSSYERSQSTERLKSLSSGVKWTSDVDALQSMAGERSHVVVVWTCCELLCAFATTFNA